MLIMKRLLFSIAPFYAAGITESEIANGSTAPVAGNRMNLNPVERFIAQLNKSISVTYATESIKCFVNQPPVFRPAGSDDGVGGERLLDSWICNTNAYSVERFNTPENKAKMLEAYQVVGTDPDRAQELINEVRNSIFFSFNVNGIECPYTANTEVVANFGWVISKRQSEAAGQEVKVFQINRASMVHVKRGVAAGFKMEDFLAAIGVEATPAPAAPATEPAKGATASKAKK